MSKFETKTCGRCGGSGHYSFNLMYGTMCFGCKGSGIVFTKRGAEARRFYDESLTVAASDLQIGMGIKEGLVGKTLLLSKPSTTVPTANWVRSFKPRILWVRRASVR